jgi:hypothetical protein
VPPPPPVEREEPEEPEELEKPKQPEEPEDDDGDGFRLRFGSTLGGGIIESPTGTGAVFSLSARLGFQFNHHLGIYYQNTPMVTLTPESTANSAGFEAGFIDYNSLLASFTVFHVIDLGAGPSLDYVAVASCGTEIPGISLEIPEAGCESTSAWYFGAHARASLILGGLTGSGPRRSGFAISADLHPVFLPEGPTITFTLGLGSEWY